MSDTVCRQTQAHRFISNVVVYSDMKIVIVGYGRVGSQTARVLDREGHEMAVVDTVQQKVNRAREQGFIAALGDGTREVVLSEVGVETADAVGGFTGDPDVNDEICTVAASHGARTVMRISEDVSAALYQEYTTDADDVIYPEQLGAAGAKTALLGGDFGAIADLTQELAITVLDVPESAPIVGGYVNEIDLGERGRVYAHGHDNADLTIPLPGTLVEADDRLAVIMQSGVEAEIRAQLFGTDSPASA